MKTAILSWLRRVLDICSPSLAMIGKCECWRCTRWRSEIGQQNIRYRRALAEIIADDEYQESLGNNARSAGGEIAWRALQKG